MSHGCRFECEVCGEGLHTLPVKCGECLDDREMCPDCLFEHVTSGCDGEVK